MNVRFHARYPGTLCSDLDLLRDGAALAAWRLEPVRTVDGDAHLLDLTFVAAGGIAVVGGIALDRRALADRGRSPFIAPREAAPFASALKVALTAIEPELTRAFAACGDPDERFVVVEGVAETAMAERRALHAPGSVAYAALARARGLSVADDAYLETCVAGALPGGALAGPTAFGPPDAQLACYIALSDAQLANAGGAYRAARDAADALWSDELRVDVAGYDGRPLERYDFVHVVGLDDPHAAAELLAQARARGARAVLTPRFDDAESGGYWGARAHVRALRTGCDEAIVAAFLETLAQRGAIPDEPLRPDVAWEPSAGHRDAQRTALRLAHTVFVGCAAEAQRIRALGVERAFSATVPLAAAVPAAEPGAEPYVLAVAPVGPLGNGAILARAAARAGLPVRFAGVVTDGAYAARARSYLDGRSCFAPGDPGGGVRIAVDVSWTDTDLGALASYAGAGVPVVASARSDARDVLGPHGVWIADPGNERALERTLREAWDAAAHGDPSLNALAEHVRGRSRADVLRACLIAGYRSAEPAA